MRRRGGIERFFLWKSLSAQVHTKYKMMGMGIDVALGFNRIAPLHPWTLPLGRWLSRALLNAVRLPDALTCSYKLCNHPRLENSAAIQLITKIKR